MSPGSRSARAMSRMTRARPSTVPAETGKPTRAPAGPQARQQLPLLRQGLLPALFEAPLAGSRLEVPDVAEDHRHQRGRAFTPPRPGDVDLADAPHAVLVEPGLDGVPGFPPARELGQF